MNKVFLQHIVTSYTDSRKESNKSINILIVSNTIQEYLDDLLHRNVTWIRYPGVSRIPRTKDSARRTVPRRAYFKCLSQCLDTDHLFGKLFKSHVHSTLLSIRTNRFHFKVSHRRLLCKDAQNVISQSVSQRRRGLLVRWQVVVEAPRSEVVCDHICECCPVWPISPADLVPLAPKSIGRRAVTVTSSTRHAFRGSIPKFTKRKASHFIRPQPLLSRAIKSVFNNVQNGLIRSKRRVIQDESNPPYPR